MKEGSLENRLVEDGVWLVGELRGLSSSYWADKEGHEVGISNNYSGNLIMIVLLTYF